MVVKVAVPHQFKLRVVPDIKNLLFGSGKEIHYIGGAEVLPPPLERAAETEMIQRLGTEYDEDAKKVLIEHNLRLVAHIVKKGESGRRRSPALCGGRAPGASPNGQRK